MSTRNYDSSALINIIKAQSSGSYYNRQVQTVSKVTTVPAQVKLQSTNPQTENYDADTITTIQAGQQAYYFKGQPTTTLIVPLTYQ